MSKKKEFGQFFTTKYTYILQNCYIPNNVKNIIEPFTGNGDLLNFIKNRDNYNIECYDIDPKHDYIKKQDTLLNPPNYDNKFIITNPPYLARNKSKDKSIFDHYKTNDLYKAFILSLIQSGCNGGIIIVPLNFISSIRTNDINLRKQFLEKFEIEMINIFEKKVFDDTSYTVCTIQFKNQSDVKKYDFKCFVYPRLIKYTFSLNKTNNFIIGGEIYNLKETSSYEIQRATKHNIDEEKYVTNILLKCIDNNKKKQINLSIIDDEQIEQYIDNTPNLSVRSYAVLVIKPELSLNEQQILAKRFNEYLQNYREKFNSLFLTNYRDSNTIARKRISFKLAFKIIHYLLYNGQ